MISFEPTEDQRIAKSVFQDFARDVVRPAAAAHDRDAAVSKDMLNKLWESGAVQVALDREHAEGQGRSRILGCIVLEELGWGDVSSAVVVGAAMAFVQAVVDHGTPAQALKVRAAFSGEEFRGGAVLIQEPGFDFDLAALKTEAVRTDNGYELSGIKSFVPVVPARQDFLVIAKCEGALAGFIIPTEASGMQFVEATGALGLRGIGAKELRFSRVKLSAKDKLGEGAGADIQAIINSARVGASAILTGLSRAVFEHVTPYTKDRIAHGSPLAQKQSVAFRLADMFIDVPAMRWMCWRAAFALENGRSAHREARLTQIYCGERAFAIADEGVQLMGGHGYMRDNPVERWYRDARTLSLLEGIVGI